MTHGFGSDWRMNRRQMILMSGAACGCGLIGRNSLAADLDARKNDPLTKKLSAKQTFFCTSLGPTNHEEHQEAARQIQVARPDKYREMIEKGFQVRQTPSQAPRARGFAPANAPGTPVPRKERLALASSLLWPKASRVTYQFIDQRPDSDLSDRIVVAFEEWMPHTGLRIEYQPSGVADIRITFEDIGYWSVIGIQARQKQGATLSIQPGNSAEYQRATLHETGHALGAIHEHQAPTNQIPWDKQAVYAYYKANFNWDPPTVDDQVLNLYNDGPVSNSTFDKLSIMNYVIPDEVLLPGKTAKDFEVPQFNQTLSDTDRKFMEVVYGVSAPASDQSNKSDKRPSEDTKPKVVPDREKLNAQEAKPFTVNTSIKGDFSSDAQMHLYKIEGVEGDYIIETVDGARVGKALSGAMPVVVELFNGTDFAEDKSVKTSTFGAFNGSDTKLTSLGVLDAFLAYNLKKGTPYYALVRPQQRLKAGDKVSYTLYFRPAGTAREHSGVWDQLRTDIKTKLEKTILKAQNELGNSTTAGSLRSKLRL